MVGIFANYVAAHGMVFEKRKLYAAVFESMFARARKLAEGRWGTVPR